MVCFNNVTLLTKCRQKLPFRIIGIYIVATKCKYVAVPHREGVGVQEALPLVGSVLEITEWLPIATVSRH